MNDNELLQIREKLKLYTLTDEEINDEFNKFKDAGGQVINKKTKNLFYKSLKKNDAKLSHEKKTRNNVNEHFKYLPLIKQVVIPKKSMNKSVNSRFTRFINNLKIDLFAVKHNTKVKTGIDLIMSFFSFFSYKLSDYINNKFLDTIHIDILEPLNDLSLISKELMKIKNKDLFKKPEILYLFKIFHDLNSIDTLAVTSYINTLKSKVSPPYKYYEIAPILKNLYMPLIKLNYAFKTNEIKLCLNFYARNVKERSNLINTYTELLDKYFTVIKKALFVILLKDLGGIFYNFDNELFEYKTKELKYFNITENDIHEKSLKEFIEKYNLTTIENQNKEYENIPEDYNPYGDLPPKFNDILEILNDFFPSCIFELKDTQNNSDKVESKFDIRELAGFTDIFRYFFTTNDISNYMLDDRFLYFSRYYPMSQLSVFSLMIIDLLGGLVNLNYLDNIKIEYEGEGYYYPAFFKNILNDISILYKFSLNKLGDIIRDVSLSFSDNSEYLKTSSFEIYLDEMTIFLKNNYLNNIEFNKTINGINIYDQKYIKFDAKKTLFIDPFYVSIKKLKYAIDQICANIDKRNKNPEKFILPKNLDAVYKDSPLFNQKSAFYNGFKSIFIKTDYDGIKLTTKDQRTLYNYLFFVQKFIDLIDYIVNSNKSYLLNFAYPSILRAQPNKLIRVIDEGTKNIIIQSKTIFLSPVIKQRLKEKHDLILENIKLKEEVEKSNIHITSGVYTKKYFLDYFPKLIEESKNENKKLSLLIMDLDNFKSLNDSAGHKFGDFILENVGRMLKDILRKDDLITDYKGDANYKNLNKFASCFGGDEFVLLLTQTDIKNAKIVAERILEELNGSISYIANNEYKSKLALRLKNNDINQAHFDNLVRNSYSIGASIGIAELQNNFNEDSFFDYADTGVYASKMNGKNSYSLYDNEKGYKVYKKENDFWLESLYSYDEVKSWQSNNE